MKVTREVFGVHRLAELGKHYEVQEKLLALNHCIIGIDLNHFISLSD